MDGEMGEVVKNSLTPINELRQGLEARRAAFAATLPKHVTVERFMRSVVLAAAKNPAVMTCDRSSLFLAVNQACQLGLDCSGTLGSAYLVPFKGSVQLIPGYRGLIDLCKRSGEVSSIYAHTVHEKDKFEIELGSQQKITHIPYTGGERGEVVSAYAVAVLKDGATQFDFMTRHDVDAIRRRSRAGQAGPWTTDFAEMAKKTVIRRLVKYLPISTDLERAIEIEDRDADLNAIEVMDDVTAAATATVQTPVEDAPVVPDVPFK